MYTDKGLLALILADGWVVSCRRKDRICLSKTSPTGRKLTAWVEPKQYTVNLVGYVTKWRESVVE